MQHTWKDLAGGEGQHFFFCSAVNNLLELIGVGAGGLCQASGPF